MVLLLNKLKSLKKIFNARQFYKMIIRQDIPKSSSDNALFNKYSTDPDLHNVLLMTQNLESQSEVLLHIFEKNFAEINKLVERKKRFRNIFERLGNDKPHVSEMNFIKESEHANINERTVIDAEYLKHERAKWIRYFSAMTLTPTETKLARGRLEKLQVLTKKQIAERKRKSLLNQQKKDNMKAIISLYKAPRVTNRLRQAIDQITADGLMNLNCPTAPCRTISEKTVDEKQHFLADGLMEAVSWTSCCSECRRLNRPHSETALDRFHSTQEQFLNSNYCDYGQIQSLVHPNS
ncbi:hypothetical protein KR093_007731 [Drosophila rubida]|uniref:Uncharacterized protein n=1 Tax=Drosophila rubida TaxID=30044 RepID=A0AAD4K5I6_9MUSC|nr:hypothetical protein KR093_007731 [Drosophila rubida]